MPIPKPNKGEEKDKYMSRCLSFLKEEGKYTDHKQRIAICMTSWDKKEDRLTEEELQKVLESVEEESESMDYKKLKEAAGKVIVDVVNSSLSEDCFCIDDDLYDCAGDAFNKSKGDIDRYGDLVREEHPDVEDEVLLKMYSNFNSIIDTFNEKMGRV